MRIATCGIGVFVFIFVALTISTFLFLLAYDNLTDEEVQNRNVIPVSQTTQAVATKQHCVPQFNLSSPNSTTSCPFNFFCEPTGTSLNKGLCILKHSRGHGRSCWSSSSVCRLGLKCQTEVSFWDSSATKAAQQLNILVVLYNQDKSVTQSFGKVKGKENFVVWRFMPFLHSVFLDSSLMSFWTNQMVNLLLTDHKAFELHKQLVVPYCRDPSTVPHSIAKPIQSKSPTNSIDEPSVEVEENSSSLADRFNQHIRRNFIPGSSCYSNKHCKEVKETAPVRVCNTEKHRCVWAKNAACINEFTSFQLYASDSTKPRPNSSINVGFQVMRNLACCLQAIWDILHAFSDQINNLNSTYNFNIPPVSKSTELKMCQNSPYKGEGWWIHYLLLST